MNCWKCGKPPLEIPKKIGFRTTCNHCDAPLHACKNCRHFSPGKPNNCSIPGTEYIKSEEASNFCEEFSPKTSSVKPKDMDSVKSVFGENPIPQRRNFDDLFK